MRRRKITTDDKNVPSDEEVRRIMSIGQQMYKDFGHTKDTTINMDETAFTYAIGPEYMYCPPDQQRAQNIGIPNTMLRITAVVAVSGNGEFVPLFIIRKHSFSSDERPDQTGMRVIQDLHKKNQGFGEDDKWDLILWSKELTIKGVTNTHACYYIINKDTGHVITSQYKAWNDTVRMIMWLELIIKPLKEKLGKLLIWFDNCGCHKTDVVDDVINSLQVHVACLPPNMTGVLQVLDLVVNGPLKAHSRKLRGSRIVACFQEYSRLYELESLKNSEDRTIIEFNPHKPCMFQGIRDLFELFANGFKEVKFQSGIVRAFISTGCLHYYDTDNTLCFVPYTTSKICGTMTIVPAGTRNYNDMNLNAPLAAENQEVVDAMNAFLDYDSEDENAMNAILNL